MFTQFKQIKKTITKYARKGQNQGGGGGQRGNYGPREIIVPRSYPAHEEPLYENLRRRVALIHEAQGLLKMDLRQANEVAKDIQARWKVSGQIPDSFKSEVFNQFNAISDRIFESSYLARVVFTKYPHFRTMPPAEQLELKIEAMDDIILKEDMNIKITQAEFDFMSADERATDENRSRFSRLNTSVRKLKMKYKILQEMCRELERLKGGGQSSYGHENRGGGGYQQRSGGYNQGGGYGNRQSTGGYGDRPAYNNSGNDGNRSDDRPPSFQREGYNQCPPRNPSDNPPRPDQNSGSGYGTGSDSIDRNRY